MTQLYATIKSRLCSGYCGTCNVLILATKYFILRHAYGGYVCHENVIHKAPPPPRPHHTYTLSFFAHSDALYYDERVGHSTETDSCDVIRPVPRHLADDIEPFGIGQFYKKYTEAYGIPVICECHVFFRLVLAMLLDEVVLNVF